MDAYRWSERGEFEGILAAAATAATTGSGSGNDRDSEQPHTLATFVEVLQYDDMDYHVAVDASSTNSTTNTTTVQQQHQHDVHQQHSSGGIGGERPIFSSTGPLEQVRCVALRWFRDWFRRRC